MGTLHLVPLAVGLLSAALLTVIVGAISTEDACRLID